FFDGDLFNKNLLDGDLWLYTFYLTFLFVMFGMIGAGLTDDLMGASEEEPAKAPAKKAPAKKAPAKKAPAKKKTTKKATKADDE
ncbi:MAG: hypothetical protein ACXAD7_03645, partial [Candidatus Kariarchaeaceae archaeon]